jgi:RHS repeat-associated protein
VRRRLDQAVELTQTWTPRNQLAAQTVLGHAAALGASGSSVGSQLLQQRAFSYRPDGNLVTVADRLAGTRHYELDPAGRVTAVHGPNWQERYAYDPAGNLTRSQLPTSAMPAGVTGELAYQGMMIQRAGPDRFTFDRQGRMTARIRKRQSTRDAVWRFGWDPHDRLSTVVTPDGTTWRYRYDPLGRRIAKQRLTPELRGVADQTDFVWDGTQLAEQLHNHRDATTWDHHPHTAQPLTQVRHSLRHAPQAEIDAEFYAIITDLAANPTELLSLDGSVAWRQHRSLWGATLIVDSSAGTPLRYAGQYHDDETGLHYNVWRYYDPASARYVVNDCLGLAAAPNPATYVHNPTTWIDPIGLAPCRIRVSAVDQDWGDKGAHIHIGDHEVGIFPDGRGGVGARGVRLSPPVGEPSARQVQQVMDAIRADPKLRASIIVNARSAMEHMNVGAWGMEKNRAVELYFLIKALEKM